MEKNTKVEGKKISLVSFIAILLNVIAIICMIATICSVCTSKNDSSKPLEEILVHQFNGKFTLYAGIRPGAQIKQLIETVNANNINNDETDLVVTINRMNNTNQYLFNGGSSRYYKVEIEKENNKVSNINIYKTDIKIDENNSIIYEVNYNEFAEITGYMKEGCIGKIEHKEEKNENYFDFKLLFGAIIIYSPILSAYIIAYFCYKINKKKILNKYNGEERQKSIIKLKNNISSAFIIIAICSFLWSFGFFAINKYIGYQSYQKYKTITTII